MREVLVGNITARITASGTVVTGKWLVDSSTLTATNAGTVKASRSIGRTSTFLPPERTTLSPGRAAQKELRLPRRANRAHRKLRFRHEPTDVRFCHV
jgi:hypothetical protein